MDNRWNRFCEIFQKNHNEREDKVQKVFEQIFAVLFGYDPFDGEIDSHRTLHIGSTDRVIPDIIICDFILVSGFEITKGKNNKLYVINPHHIENVLNTVEYKREIRYIATASLLDHPMRKQLVDKILDAFAQEIERVQKDTNERERGNLQIANGTTIEKDILREGQNWWR